MNEKELVHNLINGKNADVRRYSAEELVNHNIYNFESIKAFAYALKDTDKGVVDYCAQALLNTPDEYKEITAERIAVYIESTNIETRNLAGDILLKLGKFSAKPLLQYLDHPDFYVRQFAIDIIGQLDDQSMAPYLVKFLDDPDSNVVNATIDALGNLRAQDIIEELQIIYNEKEEFRPVIIEAYRKIGGPEVEHILINLLAQEDDTFLKLASIDALAFVGNDKVLCEQLIDQLPTIPEEVQGILLKTIIAISFRNDFDVKIPDDLRKIAQNALMDSDPDIRIAGLLALGSEYFSEDVNYLVNEVINYNEDTQLIILNNLLKNSQPTVIEKFLREYAAICHFDQKHTEFFSLLIHLLPEARTENKEMLFKILFELIITEHVGFSNQVIESLYLGDKEYTLACISNQLHSSDKLIKKELIDIIYNHKINELYNKIDIIAKHDDEISVYASDTLKKIKDEQSDESEIDYNN